MFCVQCEQTIRTPAGNGCSYAQGMCGKTAETSDLQDLLIASLQGLSAWAFKAREYGIIDHYVDSFAPRAFFSTLTNVNFDSPRIVGYAREAIALREALGIPQEIIPIAYLCIGYVRDFHARQAEQSWWTTAPDGTILGQMVRPVDRVGLYVPGGRGAHAVDGHLHVAVGGVLEPDRHGQPGRELPVHLRFGGARANGAPRDGVGDVLRAGRLQELATDRKSEIDDVEQQ